MTTRPLGAQISHMLKARGVEVIFGIPGVHNVEMYRGIEEAGLTHVLARHEQGAGFMADGYARATGRPGVAYIITGPGLTNILTPLGQAYSDSVPVLALSSCLDETSATRGQLHQMLDQRAAADTVCDWSVEARNAASAYRLIDRALAEFETERARPKHIQVPIEVLGRAAPPAADRPALAVPEVTSINASLEPILKARKPLFILGGGSRSASQLARKVIARLGAACFTTYAGRGVIAPDYPLNFASTLGRPETAEIAASADLIVAIGTELAEVDLWRDKLGHDGAMIRVDRDPEVLTDGNASLGLLCDAKAFFARLDEMTEGHVAATDWTADKVREARARWRAETDAERPGIVAICEALRAALPPDAMIFSDMTQFAYVANEVWDLQAPGLWHHPTGFGTLGYALPAAIGGAVGRAGLPTVAIAGDYGFQYTIQELGTAVELGLPLPILLWDNGKLKEIEDCMVTSQIAPNAVVARNPDFLKLAEAYGAGAVEPKSLAELQTAVVAALSHPGPTIIRMTPALTG